MKVEVHYYLCSVSSTQPLKSSDMRRVILGVTVSPATKPYLLPKYQSWSMMSSYLLTVVGVYFDQSTTEHASFHGHRTVSDLKSGTICHRNCDTWTAALDNSETCWNHISLGFSQPRRIVTFWLLRLKLSYLLTYLLTTQPQSITALWLMLIVPMYEGTGRLSWVVVMGHCGYDVC